MNHTIISSYSGLNVFRKIWFVGEISSKLPNGLFGTNVHNMCDNHYRVDNIITNGLFGTNVYNMCDNHYRVDNQYLQYYNELILLP